MNPARRNFSKRQKNEGTFSCPRMRERELGPVADLSTIINEVEIQRTRIPALLAEPPESVFGFEQNT